MWHDNIPSALSSSEVFFLVQRSKSGGWNPTKKLDPSYFPPRAEEGCAQGCYKQPQCHSSHFLAWSSGSCENFTQCLSDLGRTGIFFLFLFFHGLDPYCSLNLIWWTRSKSKLACLCIWKGARMKGQQHCCSKEHALACFFFKETGKRERSGYFPVQCMLCSQLTH